MANGRGASLEPHERLAREPFLAVAEIAGGAASARILAAAAISPEEIEALLGDDIEQTRRGRLRPAGAGRCGRARVRRLGALVLNERPLPVPATEEAARALAEGLAVARARRAALVEGPGAVARAGDVPAPRRGRRMAGPLRRGARGTRRRTGSRRISSARRGLDDIGADLSSEALRGLLPWNLQRRLDAEAPTHVEVPTGSQIPIDYGAEDGPVLAVRVQELFGLDRHPTIAAGRVPLILHLLSPAQRPIQITRDLPGFWRGSWAAVRADMRGQYPSIPGRRIRWPRRRRGGRSRAAT